jgi:hypothetical protein
MQNISAFICLIFPFSFLHANCQAPGQGFLEHRLKDAFHVTKGEEELKEWVKHPKNHSVREELRTLDRRFKFAQFRLQRESILEESKLRFEQIVQNNNRSSEIQNFPVKGTLSKMIADQGHLSIEMTQLSKEELDIFPKEVIEKLDAKVRVNYFFPYDRFEYVLAYNGKELPMRDALLKIQGEMEIACALDMQKNHENREWYNKSLRDNKLMPYNPEPSSTGQGVRSSGQ